MGLIITIAVGIGALACLINPAAGLAAYLATIIIRPNEWIEGIKVPAIPAMIVMMSLGALLHMGRSNTAPEVEGVAPLKSSKLMVAMVMLLVLHFIVFPSGVDLRGWILGEAAPTILMLIYFTRHMNTPERLQTSLTAVTLSSIVMAFNAGYIHFFRKGERAWAETDMGVRFIGFGEPWNSYHLHGMRLQGPGNSIWGNPNDFGMLVNWAILGCIFYMRRQGSKLLKLAAMGCIAVLGGVLFLTGSRGGQLQLGINLWMAFVGGKRKVLGIFLLVVALVGVLVVLPRLSPDRADSAASKSERTELLKASYRLFKMYPIYGCGFYRFTSQNDFKSLLPHNVYAQCLAETGIIGGLIFFSMIWYLRRETSAAVKWFQKFAPFNEAYLAQCIGALQLSFSVFILFSNQFMRYTFALVMTMAMGLFNAMLVAAAARKEADDQAEGEATADEAGQVGREVEIVGELVPERRQGQGRGRPVPQKRRLGPGQGRRPPRGERMERPARPRRLPPRRDRE